VASIKLEDVQKNYSLGDTIVEALKDVDVEIQEGDFVAIMGPSGSGKSTLMNMVGALDIPTSGKVSVGDTDISSLSEDDLAVLRSKKIGFVFQQFNLIPSMNATENVGLPMLFRGNSKNKEQKEPKTFWRR